MVRQRAQRVAERIKEELADILRRRVKDPRVGFASITAVEVSNDLRHARVFVSVLGDEAEQRATMQALERARGFVRSELGARLKLFHTPELVFERDDSIAHGARINELLHALQRESGRRQDP
ncbi:MAG: 30S ribosome-binding factor RbfA [Clostridia bacterium]|nr:30S ribosome-binding factor RbfA [Clostridia bacterium]